MRKFLLFLLMVMVSSGNTIAKQTITLTAKEELTEWISSYPLSDSISYHLITNNNKTYGYDIFLKGRLTIHQPSIPSRPGNNGFLSKQDARKVALLVIKKIRKGEMPPTVTPKEIKSLGVVY